MRKKIAILGSTGSIGTSTLDICRQHPDQFEVVAISAGRNLEVLRKQIQEFQPKLVSVKSEKEYKELKADLPSHIEILFGEEGNVAVATHTEVEVVISAIVGAAGLIPTMKAIEAKKTIALANKESMVVAGELMSELAEQHQVKIIPVDSEHSAIFQCLNGECVDDVEKLVLTASGGPFFHKPVDEFLSITKEQALQHPNWDMGAKITIDSATMMNKGLEVIEAHYLFQLPVDKIQVVVHPQSIIHSMVEFVDGSVMSQMGEPDMRVPIAYALTYPRRIPTQTKPLCLPTREKLTFFQPDFDKFPCLKMAFDVLQKTETYPAVLNAANEVLVEKFLNDKISFLDIPRKIEKTLGAHHGTSVKSLDDVLHADAWAREYCLSQVA